MRIQAFSWAKHMGIAARWTKKAGFTSALLLPVVLGSGSVKAETYYVAATGNDSGPGTAAQPFRNLSKAASMAIAGDTVIVADGTYGHENAVTCGDGCSVEHAPVVLNNSGTPTAPITFQAEHKWGAVLSCEMQCDAYIDLRNSSYIVIQDFVITQDYKEAIHSNDAAHHITIRGNQIENIANRASSSGLGMDGIYINGNCSDFLFDSNLWHDIGRTSGTNTLDHAIYSHASNVTIVNNVFYNQQHGWDIQLAEGATNVLIADNTFAFPNPTQSGQIMLWNNNTGLTIRNNIFYAPQNYAITRYTSSVTSCSIDHNLVYGARSVMADTSGCNVSNNIVGANPQFVNATNPPYNFSLTAGSPAIGAGISVPEAPVDIIGTVRPPSGPDDLGAYQYSSGSPTPAPAPTPASSWGPVLAARWSLNEGSGTIINDLSGNGNTGRLNGTPHWVNGAYGTALSLDGESNYISVNDSGSLNPPGQMTVSFWFLANGAPNYDERIIEKLYDWNVKMNGTALYPQFSMGSNYAMLNYALPVGVWQHIVFTYSAGVVTGYINGAAVSFTQNTFTPAAAMPVYNYGLYIGTDSSKTDFAQGLLSDVRIYDQALSAADVAALYSQTKH